MATREQILSVAASRLGDYGKGSLQVQAIWRDVLSPETSDAAVKQFAQSSEWCGGFVLSCLRDAGATDVHWKIGSGFVLSLLGSKSATKTPQPGDIGIRAGDPARPVWHHFFLESWNGPHDWSSIDGNSPNAARHHHDKLDPTITFYSIEKLLLPEAGFLRDSPYAVPGIQDPPKEE